jgi:hypothetical protein
MLWVGNRDISLHGLVLTGVIGGILCILKDICGALWGSRGILTPNRLLKSLKFQAWMSHFMFINEEALLFLFDKRNTR